MALSCFTEDSYFDHLWQGQVKGLAAIEKNLEELWYDRQHWWYGRQHLFNHHLMEPVVTETDEPGARVKSFFQIVQHNVDYGTNFVFGIGTREDTLVKRDGRWFFLTLYVNAWVSRDTGALEGQDHHARPAGHARAASESDGRAARNGARAFRRPRTDGQAAQAADMAEIAEGAAAGGAAEESDFSPRKLKIAFACLVGMTLAGPMFVSGAITLVMTPLSQTFGWSRGEIGGALTLMTWAGALALPLAGRYADRVNVRGVLIAASVLIGLLVFALGLSTRSIWQFYGCFILLGVLGSSSVAYPRLVSALFTKHRGKALALFTAETTVVMAVMPQVMRILLEHFGWRGVFFGLGLITLVTAVPFLIIFLKDPTAGRGKADLRAAPPTDLEGMSTAEALRSMPFWLLLAANIGGGVTIYGLLPHIVGMMTSRGVSLDAAVGALSLMALFNAVGQFSSGFVVDKIQVAKIASPFLVLFLIGIVLVSRTSSATGPLPLYVGLALMGLGGASQVPMLTYFLTRYFGLRSFAEINGVFRAAQAVLTAPAPWLIGVIFDRTGSYNFAFYLFMGCATSSIVLLALLPRYRFAVGGGRI